MMIGSKSSFGVELSLNESTSFWPWMFGKLLVWVAGEPLGDTDYESTISDARNDCLRWSNNRGKRCDENLLAADKMTAFCSLDGALFGFDHLTRFMPENFRAIEIASADNFQLEAGDSTDQCKLYSVEGGENCRLLYRIMDRAPQEFWVPAIEFYAVVDATTETLEAWFAKLR